MSGQRLFVAIDLPDEIAARLSMLDPHYRGLIFAAPEQVHLTLGFFAKVQPVLIDQLMEKLAVISFRAFFLPVTGLGVFSRNGVPHILWIGVGQAHPHLFQLHKRVNEAALACNLPIEERAWMPHFTIARGHGVSKEWMRSFLKKHGEIDAGMFRVDAFHLYHSLLTAAGAIHQRLLTIKAQQST
jgi:RNA 2',3'-cyclic 3'-phosphodiesterase